MLFCFTVLCFIGLCFFVRLEQNTAQLSSVNSDLQVQRRHNVSLEKQLGRLQIEQNKNSKYKD